MPLSTFFSIIIPTYNRAYLLPIALDSIRIQTFPDWECIIVDDGSTDNTKDLAQKYIEKDKRFRYIHQENKERSVARNNGIKNAIGKYICFLDSDDSYLPERLSSLHLFIKENVKLPIMIFTDIQFDCGENVFVNKFIPFQNDKDTIFNYLANNIIGVPQVCISREILIKNLFTPEVHISEDFELWLRIAENFPIVYQRNNATVVALEHAERSVNLRYNNSALKQLATLRMIFRKDHPGHRISRENKNRLLANCYFSAAKHYMFNNKKSRAFLMIVKSLFADSKSYLFKHKVYCLSKLIMFSIPREYL